MRDAVDEDIKEEVYPHSWPSPLLRKGPSVALPDYPNLQRDGEIFFQSIPDGSLRRGADNVFGC
jgi:hypothetical protein